MHIEVKTLSDGTDICVVVGTDNGLYVMERKHGTDGAWVDIAKGDKVTSMPALVVDGNDDARVYVRGARGALYVFERQVGGKWIGKPEGGTIKNVVPRIKNVDDLASKLQG